MERKNSVLYSCVYRWLIMLLLLIGLTVSAAQAETVQYTLTPDDLAYEDGNIVLHKQAERIGPDEWRVNVQATITGEPVEPPEIEVVFVLDRSATMSLCANEQAHMTKRIHEYDTCKGHVHVFSCYEQCTWRNNPAHYANGTSIAHDGGTNCLKTEAGEWYRLNCTDTHVHTAECCSCGKEQCMWHVDFGHCEYWDESEKKQYRRRYDYAVDAITMLSNSLPSQSSKKYVLFSGIWATGEKVWVAENLDDLKSFQPDGSTHLMHGVDKACEMFSDDPNVKKVMVIVTDGLASDKKYTSDAFKAFTNNRGVVFTVGFNHVDPNLSGMVANGGAYYRASNPGQLTDAFTDIGEKLTAMVEDPMGSTVGFDKDQINITEGTNIDGELSNAGNTIYWSPKEESNSLTGTIAYHYTVKLNEQAKTAAGVHGATVDDPVPLNNPTYFHYGTADEMKKVDFPIPYAQYAVSTLQTTWKTVDDTKTFQTTDLEKNVGCDFKKADGSWYFTGFTQDYAIKDSFTDNGATYLYVRTEITINGGEPIVVQTAKALEELVKAYEPNAYQVVHLYEKNMPLKLTVSKIVSGNMGSRNSKFDFTVTLPDMAGQTVGCTLGNTPTTLTLDVQGKASFSLSHDQTLVMNNVHGNYQVEEAPYGSYVTTVSVNDGQAEQKNSVMGKLDASNTHVAYTNSLDATIPTGVFTSSASAMAGLLLSAVMFTITRAGRRARDAE